VLWCGGGNGLHADADTCARLHRLTAKGILFGKIQVAPQRFLHVFVTHLQSSIIK
jgi:hypothetical protein